MILLPIGKALPHLPPVEVASKATDSSQLIVAEGESVGLTDSSYTADDGF
jgi:hypothetical protein